MPLSSVDHIKVYHDVEYAMFLRNVWDAWGFSLQAEGVEGVLDQDRRGESGTKMRKVRVLKGAKLVLVDERSTGVLLL